MTTLAAQEHERHRWSTMTPLRLLRRLRILVNPDKVRAFIIEARRRENSRLFIAGVQKARDRNIYINDIVPPLILDSLTLAWRSRASPDTVRSIVRQWFRGDPPTPGQRRAMGDYSGRAPIHHERTFYGGPVVRERSQREAIQENSPVQNVLRNPRHNTTAEDIIQETESLEADVIRVLSKMEEPRKRNLPLGQRRIKFRKKKKGGD